MESLIVRFWKGEISLAKSFWVFGEIISGIFILALIYFEYKFFNNIDIFNSLPFINYYNFSYLTRLIFILWMVFLTVGVWRAAENYKGHIAWIILTFIYLSPRLYHYKLLFIS